MGITVSKTCNNLTPKVGDTIIYTIIGGREQNATAPAETCVITDTLPSKLELVTVSASKGDITKMVNTFTVKNFTLGTTESITIMVMAKVLEQGTITNSVRFTCNPFPNGNNDVNSSITITASQSQPCLHPDTLVHCPAILRPISSLRSGDFVIDSNGKSVELKWNLKLNETKDFICIKKDSLTEGFPTNDLLIRQGHPILWKGREIDPKYLIKKFKNIKRIKLNREVPIYSLCTSDRIFVLMEGIPVATWAESDVMSDEFNHKYNVKKL